MDRRVGSLSAVNATEALVITYGKY
jgi:hypothetical protein